MLEIKELISQDERLWQDYIAKSQDATFYHTLAWRDVIQKALGHRPYYLIAKEDNCIRGILPLFLVKNLIFGKFLSSVPAANYCGVCADTQDIRNALIDRAKKITKALDLDYLELKDFKNDNPGLTKELSHVTFLIPLDSNPQMVWSGFKDNVRKKIKKAQDASLIAKWDKCEIKDFYKIYTNSMKRLGSPPYGQQFFKAILREFPGNTHLVSVEYKGKPIACDLLAIFKDRLLSLFSGTYKEYFNLYPNNFICWQEIKKACELGLTYFDFGRSQWYSGAFNFKKAWGGRPYQLYYRYFLNRIDTPPVRNPNDRKIKPYIEIWKRVPNFITSLLGPKIIKYIN